MKEIVNKCKCGVFFTANEHRDYYQTVEERLEELSQRECPVEISEEIGRKMVETDTILELQFYPDTPIGFYVIYHYDYDELIKKAKEILKIQ
jgi:uncharacterized protein (UPF0248 family)